jgi:hypothetical protein
MFMSYELTIEQKPAYLHVIVTGQNSGQTVSRYMEEVVKECATRGIFRVLIEERLSGPRLGTIEVFGMVSKGSARFQRTLQAMAYVDVNAQGDVMRFAEDVAVNRGFPVKVFPSVAAAEEGLASEHRQHFET